MIVIETFQKKKRVKENMRGINIQKYLKREKQKRKEYLLNYYKAGKNKT